MSKASYSPLGQWRGKSGGQVYRVRSGQQIVSAYQPVVANPKTEGQQKQRAKFNLMIKLNSLFDARLLNGYSATKSKARAAFSKVLMKGIEVQELTVGDVDKYRARINPESIVFGPSVHSLEPEGVDLTQVISVTANSTGISVGVGGIPAALAPLGDDARIRIVDVVSDGAFTYTNVLCNNVKGQKIQDVSGTVNFDGIGTHRVYYQLLVPANSMLNMDNGPVVGDDAIAADVVADGYVPAGETMVVGKSIYLGSTTVTM